VSPSKKQAQRAAARQRYEKYLQRREHKLHRKQLVRRTIYVVLALSLVAGMSFWAFAVFADDNPPAADAAPTPSSTETVTAKGCKPATVVPVTDVPQFDAAEQVLDPGSATMTLATNCGDIRIALDTKNAPNNANSLAFLAEQGYYDGSACHRLTTAGIFVLQCGDPGLGSGPGPGYTTADENVPADGVYPAGTVAMAEPQGADAGSQFFIVYEDSTLPPNYTVVGEVTKGLDAVKSVAKVGVEAGGADGAPVQPVVIDSVTVTQP